MSARNRFRDRVTPCLPPGEEYVAGFQASKGIDPRLSFQFRIVAVTDVQIHVFSASLWRIGQPRKLLASLPPGTVIEPRQHFSYEEIHLAGERLWVSPAYQGMLREALAAIRSLRPAAGPGPA
jgi:hypothetical protein